MKLLRVACAVLLPVLAAAQTGPVRIHPPTPVVGAEIHLAYEAKAEGALLRNATDIRGEVLLVRESGWPLFVPVHMRRDGSLWRGAFALDDSGARVLLFKFRSDGNVDDNGGIVWNAIVAGADGRPLRNSHATRGELYLSGGFGEFKLERNIDEAKKDLERETTLYPGNVRPAVTLWSLSLRETSDAAAREKIASAVFDFAASASEETGLAEAIVMLDAAGRPRQADSMAAAAIAKNPGGPVDRARRKREIFTDQDVRRRAQRLEAYLREFPPAGKELGELQAMLASFHVMAGSMEKAESTLAAMERPNTELLNALAWRFVEQGEELERAERLAGRGVEALRSPTLTPRPPYLSEEEWKTARESSLAMTLDTYGLALFKQGKFGAAEKAFEEAYVISRGQEPEITARLVAAHLKTGRASNAREIAREAVIAGVADEGLIDDYRKAYTLVTGSEAGFVAELSGAREAATEHARARMHYARLDAPAPDFALKSLDGKTVRLSDLRGKVVVVDFWATWCGPCKMSFPFLQKVYEAYRNDTRVVILAVNTWEKVNGAEREELVRRFMHDNKYGFPVLFDTNSVEEYGVDGIPAKFVIGPSGHLVFKSVGFEGGAKMENELTAQIELLLSDAGGQ